MLENHNQKYLGLVIKHVVSNSWNLFTCVEGSSFLVLPKVGKFCGMDAACKPTSIAMGKLLGGTKAFLGIGFGGVSISPKSIGGDGVPNSSSS